MKVDLGDGIVVVEIRRDKMSGAGGVKSWVRYVLGSAYSIGGDVARPIGLKCNKQSSLSSTFIVKFGKRRKAPES